MKKLLCVLSILLCVILSCGQARPATGRGFITASSTMADSKDLTRYYPARAFDGDPATAWVEGAEGSGIGQTIEIDFGKTVTADSIQVMPGYFDPQWWQANNRVKGATIMLDGFSLPAEFQDAMTKQKISLNGAKTFRRFILKIEGVYKGQQFDDTCVSEIQFFSNGQKADLDGTIVDAALKPKTTFQKKIADGYGLILKKTVDDKFFLLGRTGTWDVLAGNIWLCKIDRDGNRIVFKTFDAVVEGNNACLTLTSDGGCVICITVRQKGTSDVQAIRLDSQGNEIWSCIFTSPNEEVCREIMETSNGGYIILAGVSRSGETCANARMFKIDPNGNHVWSHILQESNSQVIASAIAQTSDAGYLVCGSTLDENGYGGMIWLIKTDMEGRQVWLKTVEDQRGQPMHPHAFDIIKTIDNNYLIGFNNYGHPGVFPPAYFKKFDLQGNFLWKSDPEIAPCRGNWMTIAFDGGFVICGNTPNYPGGKNTGYLFKFDSQGKNGWQKTFSLDEYTFLTSVDTTADNGYIICATTSSNQVYLIKTDQFGNVAGQ